MLIKNQKLIQQDLAEIIGKGRALISRLESGGVGPSNTLLDIILCDWKVNPKWLYRGEGEKYIKETDIDLESLRLKGKEIIAEIKDYCQL